MTVQGKLLPNKKNTFWHNLPNGILDELVFGGDYKITAMFNGANNMLPSLAPVLTKDLPNRTFKYGLATYEGIQICIVAESETGGDFVVDFVGHEESK